MQRLFRYGLGLCQRSAFVYRKVMGLVALDFEPKLFEIGDHVSWTSEAGRVSGSIRKVHKQDLDWKEYTHHGSRDDPQYLVLRAAPW